MTAPTTGEHMEWMYGRLSWKGPYRDLRDCWVGGYWTWEERRKGDHLVLRFLSIYLCVVPCFPIRLRWYTYIRPEWLKYGRLLARREENISRNYGGSGRSAEIHSPEVSE